MTAIVDNTERRVGDFLRERIEAGSDLSIVSAYFTIYAYDALRDALESAGRTRFLHGEPGAVGVLDPGGGDAKAFRLDRDGGIRIQEALATLYAGVGGRYHYGDGAWLYVHDRTGVDLKATLEEPAAERGGQDAHEQ